MKRKWYKLVPIWLKSMQWLRKEAGSNAIWNTMQINHRNGEEIFRNVTPAEKHSLWENIHLNDHFWKRRRELLYHEMAVAAAIYLKMTWRRNGHVCISNEASSFYNRENEVGVSAICMCGERRENDSVTHESWKCRNGGVNSDIENLRRTLADEPMYSLKTIRRRRRSAWLAMPSGLRLWLTWPVFRSGEASYSKYQW